MVPEEKNYLHTLSELKEKIRRSQHQTLLTVNRELLRVYWEIGKAILSHQHAKGWGANVIERLADDLKAEFPSIKGISVRNLRYMKSFALAWPDFVILQPVVAELQNIDKQPIGKNLSLLEQIPWAHHIIILSKVKTMAERIFYIRETIKNEWSKSILSLQIDNQLYQRQGQAITNFEITLPATQSDLAKETLKNPYLFDFLGIEKEMHEQGLERALISHIKKFMLELGRGFAYVGNQFNLVVEDDEFFLDLLFYNYHLHCFVVFELKAGDFKPEYTGKLNFYINAVDEKMKGEKDAPTIGVLLCKTPNETVIKYALQGIHTPMGIAGYEFTNALPGTLKSEMPTVEELEAELEKETREFEVRKKQE
ncbi:MAG: PDDEXK nuclease domain-containing protein [Bacteroidetes bacterium]|nr:PDDEXK nuclease domain-containing protein [Bacteroidota bacterium]